MMLLTIASLVRWSAFGEQLAAANSVWAVILKHVSYLDVWWESLDGKLVPKFLLFYASLAVFCLFLTSKVLEARKWL
jgi:hypothetical protein